MPRLKYENGTTIINDRSVMEDQALNVDGRTMTIVKQIGDGIQPSIRQEIDYPLRKRLPVLDMKVCVETKVRERDGQARDVAIILQKFYGKGMMSTSRINARSAMP